MAFDETEIADLFTVSSIKAIDKGVEALFEFEINGYKFRAVKSSGHKCPRCWKLNAQNDGEVCPRCAEVLADA